MVRHLLPTSLTVFLFGMCGTWARTESTLRPKEYETINHHLFPKCADHRWSADTGCVGEKMIEVKAYIVQLMSAFSEVSADSWVVPSENDERKRQATTQKWVRKYIGHRPIPDQ